MTDFLCILVYSFQSVAIIHTKSFFLIWKNYVGDLLFSKEDVWAMSDYMWLTRGSLLLRIAWCGFLDCYVNVLEAREMERTGHVSEIWLQIQSWSSLLSLWTHIRLMAKRSEGVICLMDRVDVGHAGYVILHQDTLSQLLRHEWLVFIVASTPALVCRGLDTGISSWAQQWWWASQWLWDCCKIENTMIKIKSEWKY